MIIVVVIVIVGVVVVIVVIVIVVVVIVLVSYGPKFIHICTSAFNDYFVLRIYRLISTSSLIGRPIL
jgi:hypothetical protein